MYSSFLYLLYRVSSALQPAAYSAMKLSPVTVKADAEVDAAFGRRKRKDISDADVNAFCKRSGRDVDTVQHYLGERQRQQIVRTKVVKVRALCYCFYFYDQYACM